MTLLELPSSGKICTQLKKVHLITVTVQSVVLGCAGSNH